MMAGVVLKQINAAVNDPTGFAFKRGFTLLHVHNYAVFFLSSLPRLYTDAFTPL